MFSGWSWDFDLVLLRRYWKRGFWILHYAMRITIFLCSPPFLCCARYIYDILWIIILIIIWTDETIGTKLFLLLHVSFRCQCNLKLVLCLRTALHCVHRLAFLTVEFQGNRPSNGWTKIIVRPWADDEGDYLSRACFLQHKLRVMEITKSGEQNSERWMSDAMRNARISLNLLVVSWLFFQTTCSLCKKLIVDATAQP